MNGLFGDVSGVGAGAQPTVPQSPFSAQQGTGASTWQSNWNKPASLPSHFNSTMGSDILGGAQITPSPVDQQRNDITQALMAQPMSAASVTPATPAAPTTSPATPAEPMQAPLAQMGSGASTWQPEWGRPQSSSVNTTTGADILGGGAPSAPRSFQGLGPMQAQLRAAQQAYSGGRAPAAAPGWDPRFGAAGQGTV